MITKKFALFALQETVAEMRQNPPRLTSAESINEVSRILHSSVNPAAKGSSARKLFATISKLVERTAEKLSITDRDIQAVMVLRAVLSSKFGSEVSRLTFAA